MANDLLKFWLSRIRIVMVGTTLPANIGSAARALHTMGLDDLVVVNPRLPIDDSSYANAAGAGILLDKTCITKDIKHAIGDCTLIFAASARSRQMPRPVLTPSMAAQVALKQLSQTVSKNNLATSLDHMNQSADDLVDTLPKIAILFGREDRGLTNEELSLADYHIQIPANLDYPVLNVASAIQVITATFFDQFASTLTPSSLVSTKQMQGVQQEEYSLPIHIRSDWDEPAITQAQSASLERAIIALMQRLNLAHDDDLKYLPNRLSRLNSRLQLDQKEYALVRALIAKINQNLP
ncbi:tRNA:Cm32/Um32 methyltransferase [Moraxella catarrhalis]|uniref:RNA methyltransferase n=1 Tax=Moraxella catarrhalis TaxID=480 RepID=UPI0007E45798|nr:TrmH family RNA methyltransferase [Moraxella catarrhalis]OAV10820.1 tRNA:Cm32/Um32 methyltransferase [Moraxella catarrhalis]OAV35602.1 tRNA:Cm32/Um32 methyltransferase [Moraxella catarrhalis]